MESHSFSVEETETAVATVKLAHGNTSPIILLVAGAETSAGGFVFVIINALRLLEPDAVAQRYAGKRFPDFVAEGLVHSVLKHTAAWLQTWHLNPNSEVGNEIEKTRREPSTVGRVTPCAPRLQPAGAKFPWRPLPDPLAISNCAA